MYPRQNPSYPVPAPHPPKPDEGSMAAMSAMPPSTAAAASHASHANSHHVSHTTNSNSNSSNNNNLMQARAPAYATNENLRPWAGTKDGRTYSLSVEQQPVRARMCGFGDKDRRPITPPPCIRLIVRDAMTGAEIDPAEVDSAFFVLSVDLWDSDGLQEVNLVRHASTSTTLTISNTTTASYPPPPESRTVYMQMNTAQMAPTTYTDPYGRPMMNPQPGAPANHYNPPPPMNPHYYVSQPGGPPMTPPASATHQYSYPTAPNPFMAQVSVPVQSSSATGMFTRNLIGSLSVNAFRLQDTEGKTGFWFVLQDLSVRTEGLFRLKMSFVDVGSGKGNNTLNTGRAPVLATCFSDQFQVFSAKKFPGVIESTPLSKAFASQGIKIPIRKDGPKPLSNQAEYDADE